MPLPPAGNGAPAFVVSYALPPPRNAGVITRRYDLKKMLERGCHSKGSVALEVTGSPEP
jgi:hypothetical protein